MSARIAPESVGAVAPVADYRPPAPAAARVVEDVVEPPKTVTRPPPNADMGKLNGEVNGAVSGIVESDDPGPIPPAEPPSDPAGAAYVRAVISGALSPRPTSAQELLMRVGTGWVPPESEYRLTDKTI